ncbi:MULTISPECIES: hypothetical protein [Vagococcus]|uniref:hypothetical protein n=1 Tax=Vagococcus TaxID=2737 RepID=UPI000B35803E|nr:MULTISPECIES: hypothetical protein [Vagococcus]HCM89238.1 hypothetical protein [Vagococcus sp.]
MELNQKIKLLKETELLLQVRYEDIQEELNILAERIACLQQDKVLITQQLNLTQLNIEDSKGIP